MESSYEYDPLEEHIVESTILKTNRIEIATKREKPMNENFKYILIKINGKWLLDSRKRESTWEDKWKVFSL